MGKSNIDWSVVDREVVDFIFYQAERHLDAQLQSALASDARAITAASVLAGLSTAILAATLGYWAVSPDVGVLLAGLVSGGLLLLAAWLCVWAAKPIDFYITGNQPEEWYGSVASPLTESKGKEIENYQEMISDNNAALRKGARYLEIALRITMASPLAALLAYFFRCVLS